ncbi:Putative beta-lactamase HcpC precursor [Poriferisphaera corsica]|uniref:Beta-lactamase HcpC n=1 Tax=Poriferisphaera corsica TaxID=2528020 RepID=A0A517YU01_9BACT|nr:tetratricopeptide repeat protein [Poriferisphaera corsica]QDU33698.1 Putative beta-lactamase HcpC precursor [Poriferisphaera corsica]
MRDGLRQGNVCGWLVVILVGIMMGHLGGIARGDIVGAKERSIVDAGKVMIEGGEYTEARAYFESAIESNPELVDLHVQLGLLHLMLENKRDAVRVFRDGDRLGSMKSTNMLGRCYQSGFGVGINYEKASIAFGKAANGGDLDGMINLAYMYLRGEGVGYDVQKAVDWLEKAADADEGDAIYMLGKLNLYGGHFPKNVVKGMMWLNKGIKIKHTLSMLELARCYQEGVVVERDEKKALELIQEAAKLGEAEAYKKLADQAADMGIDSRDTNEAIISNLTAAAELGSYDATYELARLYLAGEIVVGDVEAARSMFESLAKQEYAPAYSELGLMYLSGVGFPRDYKQAAENFREAAERGDPRGMRLLGMEYKRGMGMEQDLDKARLLYERAIEGGDAKSFYMLGALYQHGEGVEQDRVLARKLYEQGVALVDETAMCGLGSMYLEGEGGVNRDVDRAIALFERGRDLGEYGGALRLGLMYWQGNGVNQNFAKARRHMEDAVRLGSARALVLLGEMAAKGLGGERDFYLAKALLRRAVLLNETSAYILLGSIHDGTEGHPTDYQIARKMYYKAYLLGSAEACRMLSKLAMKG